MLNDFSIYGEETKSGGLMRGLREQKLVYCFRSQSQCWHSPTSCKRKNYYLGTTQERVNYMSSALESLTWK